jgi:plastocyanin domain-containing protein
MTMKPIILMLLSLALGGPAPAAAAPRAASPDQRVGIRVTARGFEPATIRLKAGVPIVLIVTRTTDRTCATELAIPSRKIRQALPLQRAVEIPLGPEKAGRLRFACGMDMISGTLVVK